MSTFDKNFRIQRMTDGQSITSQTQYTTVYEYTGSGVFFDIIFITSSKRVICQFEIDDEPVIEEFNLRDFETEGSLDFPRDADTSLFTFEYLFDEGDGDAFRFSMRTNPIEFASSVRLKLKKQANNSVELNAGMVAIQLNS